MYGALTIKITEQEIKALHTLLGGRIKFGGIELSAAPDCDWSTDMTVREAEAWRESIQIAIGNRPPPSKAELDGAIGICIGVYVKLCLEIDLAKETKWPWIA